jgi:hypothetical protein
MSRSIVQDEKAHVQDRKRGVQDKKRIIQDRKGNVQDFVFRLSLKEFAGKVRFNHDFMQLHTVCRDVYSSGLTTLTMKNQNGNRESTFLLPPSSFAKATEDKSPRLRRTSRQGYRETGLANSMPRPLMTRLRPVMTMLCFVL